jgi:TolA-binding protein
LNCCNQKSKIKIHKYQSNLFSRLVFHAFYLLLLFGFAGSLTIAEDNVPAAAEELYQRSKSAYKNGQFADANQCIEEFLSQYPDSDHIAEMLFMQAFLQPDISASIDMYEALIKKYPETKWAAKSHYLQGKYKRALDEYGWIIVFYPDEEVYWPARYWKCRSLIAKGDYEQAMTALRSLGKSDSANIDKELVLMSIGECCLGMKDYKSAEAAYRSFIDAMPDSQRVPSAYLLLGKSLESQNKLEEAKKLYRKVSEDYRQSIEAYQAQRFLNNLSQPSPVAAKRGAQETEKPVQKPPEKAEPYFTIQVGAFSRKGNADRLAGKLRKKGYTVEIVRPIPGKSRLHKVRVGKFKTKSGAADMARRLRKIEKVPTEVIEVVP